MVGSISLASEVSLLLLVPTFPAKTQIKCAKEIVRYRKRGGSDETEDRDG